MRGRSGFWDVHCDDSCCLVEVVAIVGGVLRILTVNVARWIAVLFLVGLVGEAIELADFFSLLF